ncbi:MULTISPECIES: HAD family hydrolase [Niastella]|uniref:HAD family phosphatase n=1 Tax=Niastella soli TaxID=2821487 RepID=A0ABS3YNQ1_9BACT|nr:HAD family phosphatase [Niastella soli]MBO9199514.1 HAD family phosphatase [Niastella soli]
MAPVKNIIFDLGGVLLNLDVAKTSEAFKELGLTQIDELFRIGHAASFFRDYEMGTISDELFVEKAQQLAAPGTTKEQVIAAWNIMLLDFPAERVEFLKKLKSKYRLYLFSNTNHIHLLHFHKEYREVYGTEMDHLFEKAYYSHLIKHRKPDVTAYEYVINDSGVHAAETLFIDDALVNVEGAREAGLQALHLTGGKTILDLGL